MSTKGHLVSSTLMSIVILFSHVLREVGWEFKPSGPPLKVVRKSKF